MSTSRWDETWHRLREWTDGPTRAERLAAQVLIREGFKSIDPSHPLGGPDGGRDAICGKDGEPWVMAVYFPRGLQPFAEIERKFLHDLQGARSNRAKGMAFVTNQEIRLAERKILAESARPELLELFHLERLTTILDSPEMAGVRKQFLKIDYDEPNRVMLGGEGGKAPGAGGGGGAAIGSEAAGGDGGRGGDFIFMGSSGQAPGAGGGGAGAIGDGAVGGEGGGGGEFVEVLISPEELRELRNAGFVRFEYKVGRGGKGGGAHGEDGEDTVLNFVTADGRVLKSITAKGGTGGRGGKVGGDA